MTEARRGAGQPTSSLANWPLSPYQVNVQAGASAGIARGSGADWFGPLNPLTPIAPPDVAGRRFDFPPGYNLVTQPRAYEPIGFHELRAFADAYDLLRLVIETRKDQMERQRWRVRERVAASQRRAAPDAKVAARIAAIEAFFQKPDGATRWKTWLRALLEDMFVIDAATLYCQRTRSGKLCALQQLDGSTIKRVIDDWGRTPLPYPDADGAVVCPPAYQQVLKGLPAVNYSARDIIYRPRNVRAHRVYGFSPVQQVLMTVNIALRRQIWQLDYYSEGSVPDALIGVPNSWTPDQIKQFQDYWDAEFAGDLARRRRAKFVPGDTAAKVHQTKEPEQKNDFDEWLARIICFAFSIPPQWAVKAMNRATADNQSAQSEEEGLEPTKEWVKDLVDEIIADEFASPDLELHWLDEDDNDCGKSEATFEARLKIGAVTLNEVRAHLGLDPYATPAADRPMVLTATGYVPIEANANAGGEGESANDRTVSVIQKYNADEPRVPAGNPGGGQWTNEDNLSSEPTYVLDARDSSALASTPSAILSDATADLIGPGVQYVHLNVQNNAKTNNPLIDHTTDVLLQTLARIYALAGDGSGPWYGTRIHILFANDVRLQNLPGIGAEGLEESFSLGDIAKYGEDGTVRVDVYMRDNNGKVIAIWDVKTGGAVLTGARVRQLRAEVGVGSDVPVIELHVIRGATIKSRAFRDVVDIFAVLR